MLEFRKSIDRGYADHGWLQSFHSFSFADYYDPAHVGFGALRVINEDRIQPGTGFGTHGHRDMEIISYVLHGALAHKDSIGNGSTILPGDVQRMSAGTGVLHSEYNHSQEDITHFLQIWIEPNVFGIEPEYEQRHFDAASRYGVLRLVASPDGRDASIRVRQDASVYSALLNPSDRVVQRVAPGRRAYVHLARGRVAVDGQQLEAGDAIKATDVRELVLDQGENAEVLFFDLA